MLGAVSTSGFGNGAVGDKLLREDDADPNAAKFGVLAAEVLWGCMGPFSTFHYLKRL